MSAALALGIAAALEFAVAEPPQRLHPVAWFGRAIAPLDREWSRPRLVGLLGTLVLTVGTAGVAAAVVILAGRGPWWLATLAAGVGLFLASSLRMLLAKAGSTVAATDADIDAARSSLRALAGRDAAELSAEQVRSAAVESAAENLADGLVAPLGAFVVAGTVAAGLGVEPPLTLAAGTGAAAWVKAVNTMDSMLGYRSKPVGWAPARLDDAVMWLPARASALLLAVAARDPGALARGRTLLAEVPSPNSGWPMGTLAAAHDVRLEKLGVYTIAAGETLPSKEISRDAIRTVAIAGALTYALAALAIGVTTAVIA